MNRHLSLAGFPQHRRWLWILLAEMLARGQKIPSPRNRGCRTKPLNKGCKELSRRRAPQCELSHQECEEPRIPRQGASLPEVEAHRLTICKVFGRLSRMATVRCMQFPTMSASSLQWIWGGQAPLLLPLALIQQANGRPQTRPIREAVALGLATRPSWASVVAVASGMAPRPS